MIISEMNVKLTASTSGFAKAMDKAGDKVKRFKAGAGKVGAALGSMATGVGIAAAAIAAVAWPTKKLFDLGASIAETGSKFNTVFGPAAAGEVSAFLDNFANKAGLTANEAKGMVATTGAIAQGLGFTQKASGETAIEIAKLAGDLSSFNNIPTAETIHAVNSALTGEREQLKRLGIVILEADVQARAFANTGKTVAKELTQQEKATASLQLITEKAGVAVGDLDRTSGSAANVFRRLVARFKEIRDAIATALMPAFRHILTGIEDSEGGLSRFKQAILDNTGVISAWAIVAIEAFKMVGTIIAVPVRLVKNMVDQLIVAWRLLKSIVTLNFDDLKEATLDYFQNLKDVGDTFADVFVAGVDVVKAIGNAVSGANEEFGQLATSVNTAADAMNNLGGDDEDDSPVAPTIEAVKTLEDKLKDLSESFSKNFVDRMTTAAQGGKDAFKGYFAYMKKQLIALAMKALLFKAIMGVAGKFGLDLGGFAKSMTGFEVATTAGDTSSLPGAPGAGTPILSGRAAAIPQGGTVVNQNINFTVSAIDGRSAARFIKEQGGAIAEVVATAAKDSTAYRRQLQGA
jgi:hypothetical protein